jgi:hypothetical protein
MRRTALTIGIGAILLLVGCGETRTNPDGTTQDPAAVQHQRDEQSAARELDALEARIRAWQALPPAQREEQGKGFGADLERVLADVAGTSSQNKVLYWLADWRMHYALGAGVKECLDKLDHSPSSKMKGMGERLRVEWLLRTGDVAQARTIAERLVAQVPEWGGLMNLVALHELVGKPPPRTAGANISGGPEDPAATRTEPWMVYLIIDSLDDENRFLLGRWLGEIARPEYAGRARLTLVTSEGTPLGAIAKTRDLPGVQLMDMLWASPAQGGDAEAWRTAWGLSPRQRAAAVLGPGPKRLILAIATEPEDLRALLGK